MKKYLPLLYAVLFLGAGCTPPQQKTIPLTMEPNQEKMIFCSPDGTVVDHQIKQDFDSYCLIPESAASFDAKTATQFSFTILNNEGETLKNFTVQHEKIMHIILVRKDFNEFQHLHPRFDPQTGIFTLENLVFPTDGQYLLYADFVTEVNAENGRKTGNFVVSKTLDVGDVKKFAQTNLKPNTFDEQSTTTSKEEIHTVSLRASGQGSEPTPFIRGKETNLYFLVEKTNKRPGDSKLDTIEPLEPYLGAMGHLVIIQEGTDNYIHAHPTGDATSNSVEFSTVFASEGKYKLFFEFKNGGKVRKVEYVVEVKTGAESSMQMGTMDHSGMEHK